MAISKGLMWQYELKSTEIFRTGFRMLQCFNCQKYGHIAKICTADSKCGHCAGEHNTRNCTGKKDVKCSNCGKGYKTWDQSCSVRAAAKNRTVQNRIQDPGMFVVEEKSTRGQDDKWQIVGSRKRRDGCAGPQIIGADGNVVGLRRPGPPRKTSFVTPSVQGLFANLGQTQEQSAPRTVTRAAQADDTESEMEQ